MKMKINFKRNGYCRLNFSENGILKIEFQLKGWVLFSLKNRRVLNPISHTGFDPASVLRACDPVTVTPVL